MASGTTNTNTTTADLVPIRLDAIDILSLAAGGSVARPDIGVIISGAVDVERIVNRVRTRINGGVRGMPTTTRRES